MVRIEGPRRRPSRRRVGGGSTKNKAIRLWCRCSTLLLILLFSLGVLIWMTSLSNVNTIWFVGNDQNNGSDEKSQPTTIDKYMQQVLRVGRRRRDEQKQIRKENAASVSIEQTMIDFMNCPPVNSSAAEATTTTIPAVQSATDLFCQVARGNKEEINQYESCKATRNTLLSLWGKMRETVNDDNALKVALSSASPIRQRSINTHKDLQLWAPKSDEGVRQVIRELQQGDYGNFFHQLNNGRDSLFLDGGSNLGFVTLLAALETEATIVSFEAASPTWVMQQLNLACNLPEQRLGSIHSMLAALGG